MNEWYFKKMQEMNGRTIPADQLACAIEGKCQNLNLGAPPPDQIAQVQKFCAANPQAQGCTPPVTQ